MEGSDDEQSREPQSLLTSFLFGNVNEQGLLEDDVLDADSQRQISSLGKLGLQTFLQEICGEAIPKRKKIDSRRSTETDTSDADDDEKEEDKVEQEKAESSADDVDYTEKTETAVDYSDINELAEDVSEVQEVKPSEESKTNVKEATLMPPPPPVTEAVPKTTTGKEEPPVQVTTPSDNAASVFDLNISKKAPLAGMLPSRYEGIDVKTLFPDFRVDKVLRFSRIFGPGKASSLPQIWRTAKKLSKQKKKKRKDGVSDSDSETETKTKSSDYRWTFNYGSPPPAAGCCSDDEDKLMKPLAAAPEQTSKGEAHNEFENGPKVADWRFGPAQIWYDMLDVSETGDGFNYGFRLQEKVKEEEKGREKEAENPEEEEVPEDAFLMVSQLHWEDDVVWNGDDIKHKVIAKLNSKTNAAGWVPTSGNRTAQAFSQPGKGVPQFVAGALPSSQRVPTPATPSQQVKNPKLQGLKSTPTQRPQETDDTWYSIFPVENEELVYGNWEDEVIWDSESMPIIPKPKILTLDPNDENIVLGIPEDVDPSKIPDRMAAPVKVKIPHPHVKKSKLLLGKAGVINVLEQDDTPPPPPKSLTDMDPFNISNDKFYQARYSESTLRLGGAGGNLIQHSTPVVELRAPFIPTHMGPLKLRNFHRPPLRKFSHGPLANPGPHSIYPLLKTIKKKAKQREQERIASGGGDVFFMRAAEDLTGRDGDIVLMEFCEEHPPLMNQVGMCSKVKNYYKRKAGKDNGPQQFRFGEVSYAHTSPFLGTLPPGHSIQAVENLMYRAPIYEHNLPESDFLVIRTRNQFYIREVEALFLAGQECPLYEVFGPNSKRANNFVRDFLQVFIYRLFWQSKDSPRRIKMDDIKRAFPTHSESSIRKRLKQCADFKRTGMDSNWWVIKPDFRLPTEEEIRAMVSPEQCCAYLSMIAAEQRLKDAGYGEKFLLTPQEDENDEEMQLKMDDEIKVAPWNTTRAYVQAMKNKCLLQLTGPADPTGCGEGFSYVRVPNKPTQQSKEEQEAQPKRTVTGTDADLRRLSLNNAKELLRKFQVPEEEIKKLSRWEVIDVVRTLSTEKAKAGEEGMDKFSRGNRFSIAEHQERYKEECQRIFELQNRVLSSNEVLSTDEGESSEEDNSDIEELGKNLETMLANKKTSTQLSLEKEEQERQELRKMLMGGDSTENQDSKDGKKKDSSMRKDNSTVGEDDQSMQMYASQPGRVLKIYRTFKNAEGKEFTRVEIVRKAAVVDAYAKIRTSKDDAFIRQFATMDEQQKEEMKREKRRIQEQLRRIKRNQERENVATAAPPPTPKRKKPKLKPDLKLKCGACGQVGHMRTNKACPLYQNAGPAPPMNVAMTEEQEEEIEKQINEADDEDLVNVEGTKVTLSGKLFKHVEEIKRQTLRLRVPKDAVNRKRRRAGTVIHCDYLKKMQKPANRRRIDPVITLSTLLEVILNEMRDLPDVQPFLFPVNGKVVPDYYTIIQRPMDLQTIRENLRAKKYQNREDFLTDVNQIVENSTLYNGAKSALTLAATRMMEICVQRLTDKEDKFMRLEKAINPLLDDNDQVAFTFILDNVVNNKLKAMSESWPFQKPVNKKLVKDYYEIIKCPMDLETVAKKVKSHKYHNCKEFLSDIELIYNNCVLYNGVDSPFTMKAEVLLGTSTSLLADYGDHLTYLEGRIKIAQERALEQAEMDSLASYGDNDDNFTIVEDDKNPDDESLQQQEGVLYIGIDGNLEQTAGPSSYGKNILEEDLGELSSEEEGEEVEATLVEGADDQQAAEAMVQLGNFGFFPNPQQDESLDVDPEYDPSDFLLSRPKPTYIPEAVEEDASADNASVSMMHNFQPNNMEQVEEPMDQSGNNQEAGGGIDADLEISDSEDEQPSNVNQGEDGDIWF
ncbi:transcription initiation factor TFIID subunit 1 isoform X2 [Neocloeon triangulifer]|uniref:transcription initiation factor TFIID subunit 1 isoform X2 n=1 Tax=Neocloeon triangulifer TaxID=2078957 RepID=UPI00286F256A|nr:transcription initiation factor TFIID subunit 1 isoform X2 [Neocloeon triangulifer]